jgi:TetR/AcrR family transcriptional regulator
MPPHEEERDDPEALGADAQQKKRSASATQKRILDAAEQEFAIAGFAGARLREIAVSAQVQPALIHHYFNDKRGLYEAVIRRGIDQMSIAGWKVLEHERDLEGYLEGFVEILIGFYESNQALLAIMRSEAHSGSDIFVAVVREKTSAILDAVLKMTAELQKRGDVRADLSPREILISGLSLTLYPVVDAPFLQAILPDREPEKTAERRKKIVVDAMLRAIRPAKDAATR